MAKTIAPLLSFGASGQIGQTLVAGSWKGQPYMRRYVVPSNPNTTPQQLTRNAFGFLQAVYKVAPAEISAVWELYAQGKKLTARNAFTKFNLPTLRPAVTLDAFTISPGALGGLPPLTLVVTPGNDTLNLEVTHPTVVPTDWSIVSTIFAVLHEQDPQTGVLYDITAQEIAVPTVDADFDDLDDMTEYQCFAFLKWLRSDGFTAYSPALQDQGITT